MERMIPTEGIILPDDFGHWFAGLADGEACFYIGKWGCQFLLNMRADERPMLETIRDQLGFGRLSHAKDATTDYAVRSPMCRFEVATKQHCLELTRIFDRYPLRSKKARDYAIWREAVIAHHGTRNRSVLDAYKRDLAQARKYRGPGIDELYVPPLTFDQASLLEDGIAR